MAFSNQYKRSTKHYVIIFISIQLVYRPGGLSLVDYLSSKHLIVVMSTFGNKTTSFPPWERGWKRKTTLKNASFAINGFIENYTSNYCRFFSGKIRIILIVGYQIRMAENDHGFFFLQMMKNCLLSFNSNFLNNYVFSFQFHSMCFTLKAL